MSNELIERIDGEIAECEERLKRAQGTLAAPGIAAELNHLRHTKQKWLGEVGEEEHETLVEGIDGAGAVVRYGEGEWGYVIGIGFEGDTLFIVPADWTAEQIQMAANIYRNGEQYGSEEGRRQMKAEIQDTIHKLS